jgi:Glycosyltransferase
LPVIASDLPVMREVCGEAAVYFSSSSPSALASSACDLVADHVRRVSLGQSAANRARSCFAPEAIARRYLTIAKANQPI